MAADDHFWREALNAMHRSEPQQRDLTGRFVMLTVVMAIGLPMLIVALGSLLIGWLAS